MKFNEQKIKNVYLIEPTPFVDERGIFRRHFCSKEFSDSGIIASVAQSNVSENKYAYTLRGFHYQINQYAEGKTLSCLRGKIYNVVVDLREESPTFMEWLSFELTENNRFSVHIPPGCANAFMTLEDDCLIHYYCSQSYNPNAEAGIRFNDPAFGFTWPHKPQVISDRDLNHPNFDKNFK